MSGSFHLRLRRAAWLGGLAAALGAAVPAGATEATNMQSPPELSGDGGCRSGSPSQFSATYERRGVFDDTSWGQDRYGEYLLDGGDWVLDVRSRTVAVGTWERATAMLETAETPLEGPFRIVVYEEADSVPPLKRGERAAFDRALVRQEIRFDPKALDPDCPAR